LILKITVSTLIHMLLASVLLSSILFVGLTSSQPTFDPLLDVTGDGYVGIDDIVLVAEHFGASGAPINWTQLLLDVSELQAKVNALNATTASLDQRISALEGKTHVSLKIISESFNGITHATAGTVTVTFPGGSFTSAPDIVHCHVVLRAAAAGMGKGSLAYPNVSGITSTQFDVEVVEQYGSATTVNACDVTIIYLAIDIIES
jgi:hypothetical protein